MTCYSVDDDDDDEPFVNQDCPSECDEQHAEPDADADGIWTCPTTGDRYLRCDRCYDEWQSTSPWNFPVYANGDWICDLSEHDLSECSECSEIVDSDDISYDRHDDARCSDCYSEGRSSATPGITWCPGCRTRFTGFDELNERQVCACTNTEGMIVRSFAAA